MITNSEERQMTGRIASSPSLPLFLNDYKEEKTHKTEKVFKKVGKSEAIKVLILIIVCSAFALLGAYGGYDPNDVWELADLLFPKRLMLFSFLIGISVVTLFNISFFILNPHEEKTSFGSRSRVWSFLILGFLGILAYMVMVSLMVTYIYVPLIAAHFLAALITLAYEYLNILLFAYGDIDNRKIIWEIYRFILVGVLATAADFLCTSLTRGTLTSHTGLNDVVITVIAVTVGFTIGVILNYICSVFIVYKATTKANISKTYGGVVLFVLLSAVGLFIGIGMEAFFYNHLGWPYIGVFIFRTAVVLVWNYLTRKIFIFR